MFLNHALMADLPHEYNWVNVYNRNYSPSTIHAYNTQLAEFFRKYLMERAMSVYEWKLPKEVNPYYFKWVLFRVGCIGLFNDPKLGHCALHCGLEGYDLYYYPKYMLFANPGLTEYTKETAVKREIGVDGILLNLKGDFTGVWDLVSFYADQLALLYESFGVNAIQAKNSNIFGAADKKIAEEMKKVTDLIMSGKPAVFSSKDLFRDDGHLNMESFSSPTDYFGTELLDNVRTILNNFDAEIGIPTAPEKRERLISDEVNSQSYEAMSRSEMWLEDLKNECKKANELLDFGIDVNFRYNVFDDTADMSEAYNDKEGGDE